MMTEFKHKFKIEQYTIKEFNYWVISLRPIQVTLGSLVLSLKRNAMTFAEITTEEAAELSGIFKTVEVLLKNKLGAEKVNYLALMMVDHQVHYHIIPRYSKDVKFNNQMFSDVDWPVAPDISKSIVIQDEEIEQLNEYLRSGI